MAHDLLNPSAFHPFQLIFQQINDGRILFSPSLSKLIFTIVIICGFLFVFILNGRCKVDTIFMLDRFWMLFFSFVKICVSHCFNFFPLHSSVMVCCDVIVVVVHKCLTHIRSTNHDQILKSLFLTFQVEEKKNKNYTSITRVTFV